MADRTIQIAAPATGEEEWHALREPVMSGWLTQGAKVKAFEEAFSQRHQVKYAIATSSCTTALHLILTALSVGPGDEVIVPAFTWVSTSNVVMYCGATPVFVDVDRTTYNMDVKLLADKLTEHTKAIIPVHLFGLCADVDAIREAAGDIPLVEDAACAVGASYKGRLAGSLGVAGAFSFHPRKPVTTGEGGMVTTNEDQLAKTVNALRNHGASVSEEERHRGPKPYLLPEFNLLGYNYRMTDLQGAVGTVQLGKLDKFVAERQQWADYYEHELAEVAWLSTPRVPANCQHTWQAYVCLVDEIKAPLTRNEIMARLQSQGISTRPGTHAVPTLGYYRNLYGYGPEDFPEATRCERQSLTLPLHNRMSLDDCKRVVTAIRALT